MYAYDGVPFQVQVRSQSFDLRRKHTPSLYLQVHTDLLNSRFYFWLAKRSVGNQLQNMEATSEVHDVGVHGFGVSAVGDLWQAQHVLVKHVRACTHESHSVTRIGTCLQWVIRSLSNKRHHRPPGCDTKWRSDSRVAQRLSRACTIVDPNSQRIGRIPMLTTANTTTLFL